MVVNRYKNYSTAISGALIVASILIGFLDVGAWIKESGLVIATVVASIPITYKAFQALRMKTFSIELLVTIAVIGALIIGEYVESAVVTFLFLFGSYLESRTLEKTRSALKDLIDMAPQEATVVRNGREIVLPVEEIEKGDRVIVRSGGKIPVDGKVLAGQASVNEAAITGESALAMKNVEYNVFSGTIVDSGYMEIVAEKVGDDTTFAKIMGLIEEAQETKSRTEKFLDRFANYYTPTVVLLSISVYVLTRDLYLAITFLVIACPGALVIGAPVSNVAGIGNGAKNGVLVKGAEVMDQFSKVDTLVFDKTGTLTKGKPEVTDMKTFTSMNREKLLRLVAQAEMISEHHLGQTIVKEAQARGIVVGSKPVYGEVLKGKGIIAKVEKYKLLVGNRKLLQQSGVTLSKQVLNDAVEREKLGNTLVFVAIDGRIVGLISIADQIREDARTALTEMRKNGIEKIVMLTGDNRHAAEMVAAQLGIEEVHAELLPTDKVEYVKELKRKGHVVAMAGDGINDAPAIATADIGIAMGEGGTDISMETADVVLMADKLMQFSHAYALSKVTIRNMRQNTFFAVGTVFVLLLGVLMGSVHLASGMFIHEASVLLVILNAMRLLRFRKKYLVKAQVETVQV